MYLVKDPGITPSPIDDRLKYLFDSVNNVSMILDENGEPLLASQVNDPPKMVHRSTFPAGRTNTQTKGANAPACARAILHLQSKYIVPPQGGISRLLPVMRPGRNSCRAAADLAICRFSCRLSDSAFLMRNLFFIKFIVCCCYLIKLTI